MKDKAECEDSEGSLDGEDGQEVGLSSLLHECISSFTFLTLPTRHTYQLLCKHGPVTIGEVGFHGEHDAVSGDCGENDVFKRLASDELYGNEQLA